MDTLKALLDERYEAQENARQLQATEYERRLQALNHAHEQAVEVQHTYVTQDKYEDNKERDAEALKLALERQDGRLNSLENWRSRSVGAAVVMMVFAGVIGAAVAKALGV